MKSRVLLMALLALALQARAVPVSVEQAKSAARAWALRGGTLGARLGTSVADVAMQTLPSGATLYAVRMSGGGTVFLASDTEREPVIAFTGEATDDATIDPASPLWALLSRDAEVRAATPVLPVAASAVPAAASATAAASRAVAKWTVLLAEGAAADDATIKQPSRTHISSPGDLRAGPLVQSKWDQGTAGGQACYNRFTPTLSDGQNAVCGCVATAMSQVMRYHGYPTASVAPVTRKCTVQASTRGRAAVTNLTTQAGVYDWANMPLVPVRGVSDAQCDAIGKLTSDAGISVYMNYDLARAGGSGSFMFNVVNALRGVFGYANAAYYSADEVSANAGVLQRAMFSNFDAGFPVLMGISGAGGHAIVGDGYGYNGGTVYVHLNMGWSGQSDYWYNLPDIDTTSGYHFTVFDDLVFNIFPTSASGASQATLAGRVVDDATNALADAAVRVYAAGTTTLVTNGVTTANGVYGFLLPVGTYDVEIEKTGCPVERLAAVRAAETVSSKTTFSGWIVQSLDWYETYTDIPVVSSVGNAWGNDAQVVEPRARIVLGAVTNVYTTLDKAIAAAKTFVSAGAPGVQIEILEALPLDATATIDFPCALTAVGTDPATTPVVRNGTAALAVAAGGTLALSNVTFAAQASTAVTVADGGRLVIAADVDLGVPSSVAAVSTATSDGFVLAADLANGFAIDCAAAPDVNGVFGTAICDYLTASNCAAKISNVRDTLGETRGIAVAEGGAVLLKWGEIPVPLSESVGYFVDASGATNTAARLDRLLEKFQNMQTSGDVSETGEIVVRKLAGLELTKRFAVTGNLTLRGETAGVTIGAFGAAAGFDVGTGATLTVRDLTFGGYRGDSLFLVNGGVLTVGGETTFTNIEGTNTYSGAIAVLSGQATVGSDGGVVVFDGCVNGTEDSRGGAIYVDAGELVLRERVAITNCRTRSAGGGAYASAKASVRLSGLLTIRDNVKVLQENSMVTNNFECAASATVQTLTLDGPLTMGSEVGVWCPRASATNGASFMSVSESFTDRKQLLASCMAFSSDKFPALKARLGTDYQTLQWEKDDGSIKPVDQSVAVACVTANGASTYYGSLADAFGVLTGNATVTLLADVALQSDITVTNAVTLAGGSFAVWRFGQGRFSIFAGGTLTLTAVTIDGGAEAVDGGAGNLFVVHQGGVLTLDADTAIRNVASGTERAGGAISVLGGTLTMRDGAEIRNCRSTVDAYCCGGAVAADSSSRVRLLGGTVADCVSDRGGGVYIGNETTVEIGGGFVATDNTATDGSPNNLYVASGSTLLLVSPFTGRVGYVPGVTASSNVFGRVATDFSGTAAQIADSAHNFTHDLTGDVGFAVTGGDETWLVWSDALGADGKVTIDETTYEPVPGGATLTTEIADVVTSFVYDGTAKVCLSSDHGYILTCAAQTNAGSYTATATPKAGFTWADGATAARTISWTIAKSVYDMSGVTFVDQTFIYDGKPHALAITGTLPTGVTVAYTIADSAGNSQPGNEKTEIGVYTVTATFTGDADNYEPIPALTATLTIAEKVDPPDPDPPTPVTTNYPTPIAFRAITRVSDMEWTLEITNRVPWCHYRLLATDDLTKGFVTTGAWERAAADADPVWTTNVITTGGAQFWKAEAKEGIVEE